MDPGVPGRASIALNGFEFPLPSSDWQETEGASDLRLCIYADVVRVALMPLPVTHSTAEVAESIGRPRPWLIERCKLRPDLFPSLKVGSQVRFTDQQAATITSLYAGLGEDGRHMGEYGRPVRVGSGL